MEIRNFFVQKLWCTVHCISLSSFLIFKIIQILIWIFNHPVQPFKIIFVNHVKKFTLPGVVPSENPEQPLGLDVRISYCGLDVFVSKEFLHVADACPVVKEVGRGGMPYGMSGIHRRQKGSVVCCDKQQGNF